jgi:hypothetical protein
MKRLPIGLRSALVALGSLIGIIKPVGGTEVTVSFSGTCVTGEFHYDPSLAPKTPPPNSGVFPFVGNTPVHGLCTTLTGGSQECAQNAQCRTFQINTPPGLGGGTSFTLVATYTTSAGATEIDISLTTLTSINGASLPHCSAFHSGTTGATGMFTKKVGGVQKANCSITVTSCTP